MKLGIATWEDRVSPVLDVAKHLLVVDAEAGEVLSRREVDIEETSLIARARRISEFGVGLVICGAVSWPLEEALVSAGVRVIPQTCGPVEDVLRAFLSGQLTDTAFLMPGCWGHRRRMPGWRHRGQRAGGAKRRPTGEPNCRPF